MKKIIFLLAFSAVFFAGCGKQTETAENSVPEPSASETETVTETETTATETETTAKVTETTVQTTAKPTETTVSETVQTTVQTVVTEETVISAEVPDEQQNTETVTAEEQPEVQFNVIIDDVEVLPPDEEFVEQNYDPVLHELGIDIVLTGTPAEQAIQYGEALSSVFPGHINYGDASCAPITIKEKKDEMRAMSTEELSSLYNNWLAGRNWQDLSDQELFDNAELAIANGNVELWEYLVDKYSRTFAEGTGAHFL